MVSESDRTAAGADDDYVYEPMGAAQRAVLEKLIAQMNANADKIPEFATKTNAREKGVTLYLSWSKKVDVFTAVEFAEILCGSPEKLHLVLRKLLAADARLESLLAAEVVR